MSKSLFPPMIASIRQKYILSLLMILLFGLPFGIHQAQEDTISGQAYIDSVIIERNQGRVQLRITGELADPCTRLERITQTVNGDVITVTVPTSRPVDVMCATVLEPFATSYLLSTGGLTAGDYTLIINDYATIITLTSADMSARMGDVERPPCYRAVDGTQTVIDLKVGLCFLAPQNARISSPYADTVLVRHNVGGNLISLLVRSIPTNITTLAEVARLQIAAYDDIDIDFQRGFIGQHSALISDTMSVPNNGRRAYVLAGDRIYRFTITPFLNDNPDIQIAAQQLWNLSTQSMSFINADTIKVVDLEFMNASFALPLAWTIEPSAGGYVLIDEDNISMASFVRFNIQGDANPLQTIAATYGTTVDPIPEFRRLGSGVGLRGYRLNINDTCRTYVLLRDDGIAHVMLLSPAACDLNRNVTNTGIEMMLDTFSYTDTNP